ncbi:MAG TPA: fatty acid desaturase [Candidatus Solibacter sp.]|nr:fatty acid desaturase [Candidatus Solibacter sp.]
MERWELLMLAIAAAHGWVLLHAPAAPFVALGVWWNSNTISHNFIHRPFFRSHAANRAFALYLSVLLGIPQSLWRDRHLAHHAGRAPRLRIGVSLIVEIVAVVALWIAFAAWTPRFFLTAYVPGYLGGLALCALHGHYEHARGTTSHYGRLYNLLCFNDGYHAEHHANPSRHWTRLPRFVDPSARVNALPAPLRWLPTLETLERIALGSPLLRRWLIETHARAIASLLPSTAPLRSRLRMTPHPPNRVAAVRERCLRYHIVIIGGGLFPRTALVFRRLLPGAQITIVDADGDNLDRARNFLHDAHFIHASYPNYAPACDLLVIPLAFTGDRDEIYRNPPARAVLVHDWIWRRRGVSRIVSLALLKRINLVTSCPLP